MTCDAAAEKTPPEPLGHEGKPEDRKSRPQGPFYREELRMEKGWKSYWLAG